MMEVYMAYSNYEDMMQLIENIFKKITKLIFKTTKIKYEKYNFDFSKPFNRLTMKDAILQFNPTITLSDLEDIKKIKKFAKSIGIEIKKTWGNGKIETEIFEKTVEKKLIQPTFITQYPVEVSPLARRNDKNPNITDRFELFVAGYEIANGFSELNDSEDQESRFLNQIQKEKKSNKKNIFYDQDYIEALKYGLPPTSGLGVGIDRLIMILTNQMSIRDVILFPTLRSHENYFNK